MNLKHVFQKLKGPKEDNERNYKNKRSQSNVQVKRLDNYSEIVLEALESYISQIEAAVVSKIRKTSETTMMASILRKSSQETTNRETHMKNVMAIAIQIAEKLGLCTGAVRVIAENHDIGHTPFRTCR